MKLTSSESCTILYLVINFPESLNKISIRYTILICTNNFTPLL